MLQHPHVMGGFECGFLLTEQICDFPSFQPFASMLKTGWNVSDEDLAYICQAEDRFEAYDRLKNRSSIFKNLKDFDTVQLIDKTPRYMQVLPSALKRLPEVPCVVIVRDPRAVFWSWAKRSNLSPEEWASESLDKSVKHYISYGNALNVAIKQGFKDRILVIQYETLCTDPKSMAKRIFDFINLSFDDAFLNFNDKNRNFKNVYGKTISSQYLEEYKNHFSEEICQSILQETKEFSHWAWHSQSS